MEKIQENICKQACLYVFVQENYIKAHVCSYFLHLVLTFTPHYIIMVKGLFPQPYVLLASFPGSPKKGGEPGIFYHVRDRKGERT